VQGPALDPGGGARVDYSFPGRTRRLKGAGEGVGSSRGRGPPNPGVVPGRVDGLAGGGCLGVTRCTSRGPAVVGGVVGAGPPSTARSMGS